MINKAKCSLRTESDPQDLRFNSTLEDVWGQKHHPLPEYADQFTLKGGKPAQTTILMSFMLLQNKQKSEQKVIFLNCQMIHMTMLLQKEPATVLHTVHLL